MDIKELIAVSEYPLPRLVGNRRERFIATDVRHSFLKSLTRIRPEFGKRAAIKLAALKTAAEFWVENRMHLENAGPGDVARFWTPEEIADVAGKGSDTNPADLDLDEWGRLYLRP